MIIKMHMSKQNDKSKTSHSIVSDSTASQKFVETFCGDYD